jgi:molecular chaperone IbpA
MRTYDLSPLFRSSVGFDRMTRMLESALKVDDAALSYPPYNIEKLSDDAYRITMAVAGFGVEDLDITSQENLLVITGKAKKDAENGQYLYRGIAGRAFERRFQLADHIKVTGASLVNGLLHVELVREIPETMKPRTISISSGAAQQVIDQKQAA